MATESVPSSVLDASALAFHSTANRSLGCAQARGLFWPLSCDRFVREHFELRHHLVRASRIHSDLGAALGFPSLLRAVDVHRMASVWEFKVGADHSQARFILPDSFAHDKEWADGVAADSAAIRRAETSLRSLHMLQSRRRRVRRRQLMWPMRRRHQCRPPRFI